MYYYSFSTYLKNKFGCKVRRISLDAGFTCPNRDGTISTGGCVFCNDAGYGPFAGAGLPLERQIEKAINGGLKGKKAEKFIAYFQTGTSTYGDPEYLRSLYDIVTHYPDVVGLYISTRPDCVNDEILDLIAGYMTEYDVWIEYGVQTSRDATLVAINRGHDFSASRAAIRASSSRGIKTAAHVILGLPGETKDDMLSTAAELAALPLDGIKLHVLHVLKGTKLEEEYLNKKVGLLSRDEYAALACDFLENTPPDRVIMRLVSDAKEEYLVAPDWINDKPKALGAIEAEFGRRGTRQGCRIPFRV